MLDCFWGLRLNLFFFFPLRQVVFNKKKNRKKKKSCSGLVRQDLWGTCLGTHVGDFTMLTGLCGGVGGGGGRGAAGFHHLCLGFFGRCLQRVSLLLASGYEGARGGHS